MTEKLFYYKFDIGSWRSDRVFYCSLAARGLWLEMMNMMHGVERIGYLGQNGSPIPSEKIALYCGSSLEQYETLLSELDNASIPSRTSNGIIYSRRIVRDAKKRNEWSKSKEKQRDTVDACPANVPIAITIGASFDLFWKSYPKKVGKVPAEKSWLKVSGDKHVDAILLGVENWRRTSQWDDPQFIPHAATFLNQRRWEDEVPALRPKVTQSHIEAHVGAGPTLGNPQSCAICGKTGSWHANEVKHNRPPDHEFAEEAVSA